MNQTKYLTDEEQFLLRTKIEHTAGRNALIFGLLLVTGARASEILGIRAEEISRERSTVFIRGLKGSYDREMPVPLWLFQRLLDFAPVEGLVFPISYNRLHFIWMRFRPIKKKLHALRHTYAIGGYKRTKDIRLLQGALGHKDIKNTMVYMSFVNSAEERRALLE